jgi:ATP-dependent DNA helicase PIF1
MSSDVIRLSRAQAKIVELVRSGNNIFFTGPAGSGKSCVLRSIRSSYEVDGLYFVAPTGSAAANIGGSTIHSFAGMS